jgi:hypothetical protein
MIFYIYLVIQKVGLIKDMVLSILLIFMLLKDFIKNSMEKNGEDLNHKK